MDRATNGDAESEGVRGAMGELGIPTGLPDATAQVLETVCNCLQILQMFQGSVPPRRRRGPSRLLQCPELGVHGTRHPLQACFHWHPPHCSSYAADGAGPCMRQSLRSEDVGFGLFTPPAKPARHRLSLLLSPVPGFAVSCFPLRPLADSPAPTWAEPARC